MSTLTDREYDAELQKLHDQGDIYLATYQGYYSTRQEQFLQEKDRNPDGTWPEIFGEVSEIVEKNYFFRLSKYRDALIEHYAAHPTFVEPESRRNEMLALLKGGLEDISVSRAGQAWGIPLPFDPQSVVYVWFDAPIEYIGATKEWADANGHGDAWRSWWYDTKDVLYYEFMGKDNVPFHTVGFPVTLMGSGEPWKLVDRLKGFNWLNYYGGKFSTSEHRGVFMDCSVWRRSPTSCLRSAAESSAAPRSRSQRSKGASFAACMRASTNVASASRRSPRYFVRR